MSERKPWSAEQDSALRYFKEDMRISKWSSIAQKMVDDFRMTGRSGKQCRQRYHNYLDSSIAKTLWSREEQLKLFQMHDDIGNKWAVIAQALTGRTDNCAKNHFYSKLRKSVRKLNKIIHDYFRKEFKEIKTTALYKIIEANQERHKNNVMVDEGMSNFCLELKNRLLNFSDDNEVNSFEGSPQLTKKLIQDVHQFSKLYKRQPKRPKKSSGDHLKVEQNLRPRVKSSQIVLDESEQYEESYLESEVSDRSKMDQVQKQKQKQNQKQQADESLNRLVLGQKVTRSKSQVRKLQQPPPSLLPSLLPLPPPTLVPSVTTSINISSFGQYRIQQNLYKTFQQNPNPSQNSNLNLNPNLNVSQSLMQGSNPQNMMTNSNNSNASNHRMMEWSGGSNVEDMLKSEGLILNENGVPMIPGLTKNGSRASKMSNELQQHIFFQDSEFHNKTFPFNLFGNVKKLSNHEQGILEQEK